MLSNSFKKGVVVAVILLFIGLAFAPSINANVSKASVDSELVEITTEVCGLNGGEHTASLSKEDAIEVEQLIDNIQSRLDEVETREEAVEIFNEAVIELDKYGLLGGLSVNQAQKLVLGPYQNVKFVELIDSIYSGNLESKDKLKNFFCLTLGQFGEYELLYHGPVGRICYSLAFMAFIYAMNSALFRLPHWLLEHGYVKIADLLAFILAIFLTPFAYLGLYGLYNFIWMTDLYPYPVHIGSIIYLGQWLGDPFNEFAPSNGYLSTFGLLGRKSKNGSFYGNLPIIPVYIPYFEVKFYPGILGFNGLRIINNDTNSSTTLIGFSLWINVKSEPPKAQRFGIFDVKPQYENIYENMGKRE